MNNCDDIEWAKAKAMLALSEYEDALDAYEIWLQAWRARMAGYEGYDEICIEGS